MRNAECRKGCATDVSAPALWRGLIRAATRSTDKPSRCEGISVAQSLAAFLILALAPGAAFAAATGEVLAKFPAASIAEGQALAADLVKLGPAGVKEICGQLMEPGQGDDSKARFALHGIVLQVTRPGADAERLMAEGAVLEALAAAQKPEVKAFLLEQLKLVGKDAAVAQLSGFLADERLCEPATQALLQIRTPAAGAALSKALPEAKGKNLVTIVRALGELREKSAAKALLPLAAGEDAVLRQSAWFALANIADPAAGEALAKAAAATGPYERSVGTSMYLLLASRLAEAGDKDACAKICRSLLAARTDPRESNVYSGALATLAGALGAAAIPEVLAAVDNKDLKIREAALQLLAGMEGPEVTAALVAKLKSAAPEARANIIRMLGRRGDKAALPALKDALKDDDKAVRLAAIPALAALGGGDAVAPLLAVMEAGQPDELKTAKDALLTMKGEGLTATVGAAVPKAAPGAKAALLELLGARGATDQAAVIFDAAADKEPPVRMAALRALTQVAGVEHAPKLLEMLLACADPAQGEELKLAVVAACRKGGGAMPVLAVLPNAKGDSRTGLLKVLARLGGEQALQAVLTEAKSDNPPAREAAIRALGEWCDAAAAAALLGIARDAKEPTHHVLALRGYLRLVALPNTRPPEQTVGLLKDALSAAQSPDDKKQVLGALGGVRHPEAAALAGTCLSDAAVKEEAAAAVVAIVCPFQGDKGLRGPGIGELLAQATAATTNEGLRKKAQAQLTSMRHQTEGAKGEAGEPGKEGKPGAHNYDAGPHNVAPEGFTLLFNGKDLTNWKGLVGNPLTRAKMTPEALAAAEKKATEEAFKHWKVEDGMIVYDGKNNNLCTEKKY
ncbi:MAG: HEAT repeat domain-containing protein, partial [Planctomycetota bacterium]